MKRKTNDLELEQLFDDLATSILKFSINEDKKQIISELKSLLIK